MIFAETHVRFASPGFYEEELRIDIRPVELRRSSVKLAFRMLAGERLIAEGWGTLVGYDYESGFGTRMRGTGPFAQLIEQRFRKAYSSLGYRRLRALDEDEFVRPRPDSPQGSLF